MAENRHMTTFESFVCPDRVGENHFICQRPWTPTGAPKRAHGGYLMAQAMFAAYRTVPAALSPNSLHIYFIKMVQNDIPVGYKVRNLHDSTSEEVKMSSRLVDVIQGGSTMCRILVSFHKRNLHDLGGTISRPMPQVPLPDQLATFETLVYDYARQASDTSNINLRRNMKAIDWVDIIDIKPLYPDAHLHYFKRLSTPLADIEPRTMFWARTTRSVEERDRYLSPFVAVIFSDLNLTGVTLMKHPTFTPSLETSLDHAVWFHEDFDPSAWILILFENNILAHGRSFLSCHMWDEGGRLVATAQQEALFRSRPQNTGSKY